MRSRFLLAITLIFVLAASFAAVGYAYTASTENSGNTATSEYVVLTQTEYTFSSSDLALDIVSTDAGTAYRLVGGTTELTDIDGRKYYGFKIGEDTLTATIVGGDTLPQPLSVEVSTPISNGSWFVDFSDRLLDWRYVLVVEKSDDHTKQYAYYDGAGNGAWKYSSGTSLSLAKDVVYNTTLYLAAPGVDVADSLRAALSSLKVPKDITISPVWEVADTGDTLNYALKPNGAAGSDKIVYVKSGDNLVLPENVFTAPNGKVFAGWMDSRLGKIFMPWYVYEEYSISEYFTAQWETTDNCWQITFEGNGSTGGTMDAQYVKKSNTYTLPMCGFYKTGYVFTGWAVTGSAYSYTEFDQPFEDIANVSEALTLTAQWASVGEVSVTLPSGCTVSGQGTFTILASERTKAVTINRANPATGNVIINLPNGLTFEGQGSIVMLDGETSKSVLIHRAYGDWTRNVTLNNLPQSPTKTYYSHTDVNGKFTLPDNIFASPENIDDTRFTGWKSIGWSVSRTDGVSIAQSYTMPIGVDDHIVYKGIIKFAYKNNLVNGQE